MLFHTPTFLVFLLALLGVLCFVHRPAPRKLALLLASYVFYMWWNPAFILLILCSTAVDYVVGRRLDRTTAPRGRTLLLLASLVVNLGLLGAFKYAGFLEANLLWLLRALGGTPHWTSVELVLPVGISFYTFQTLSYTIDRYRGRLGTCRSPLDFALFVAFFPQLVAGPIVRAADFLPQLERPGPLTLDRTTAWLLLRGLVKKAIIADNVAVFADAIFADPSGWPSVVVWCAALAFAVQIYCDFSGYSDLAVGLGRLLGFALPQNFDRPYLARTPTEFWRRWHITLSTWFRDYVYIPLGGGRRGPLRNAANVLVTMLLAGLWHGASWNFVLWGAFHGVVVLLHRALRRLRGGAAGAAPGPLLTLLGWLATQYAVLLGWLIFRLRDTDHLVTALERFVLLDGRLSLSNLGLGPLGFVSAMALALGFLAAHVAGWRWGEPVAARIARWPLPATAMACAGLGLLLFLLWPLGRAPFIYFQF